MVHVVTDIVINRAINVVAEYAANPDNASVWYDNIKSSAWKSPKPLQVGSLILFKAAFLGKELSYTYEIVDYLPEERSVMRTAEGPFPMETTYRWKVIADQKCQMTLQNTGEPSGFSKMLAPFMEMMMRRANNKDLRKLKRILEQ